ncbi:MAG: ribonuclease P protein component [Clostridia bacterium]|nr:ribonuclease P protein component [Clostridia bacterium]
MLKKENRLKKRYQYNYVYKKGEKINEKHICIYFTTSKTKDIKVGFAVTKKIGKAHIRNLVRRRLREIVYRHLPNLKQNYNIIVVAKENIIEESFAGLEKEFANATLKAGIRA